MRRDIIFAWLKDLEVSTPLFSPSLTKRERPTTTLSSPRKWQLQSSPPMSKSTSSQQQCSANSVDEEARESLHQISALQSKVSLRQSAHQQAKGVDKSGSPTRRSARSIRANSAEEGSVAKSDANSHNDDIDKPNLGGQATPRPPKIEAKHTSVPSDASTSNFIRALASDERLFYQEPGAGSSKTFISNQSSTKRSTSPVKRVITLRDVGGGVFYEDLNGNQMHLGSGGQELFGDLSDVADKVGILPASIRQDIATAESATRIRDFQLNTEETRNRSDLLDELSQIRKINRLSRRCERDLEGEAEWNHAVHSAVLRLALGSEDDEVGVRYITNAEIDSRYVPQLASGLTASSKMIDYALFIGDGHEPSSHENAAPSESHSTLSRDISNLVTNSSDSINHIPYPALRHRPIGISIETKTISRTEEEARVQLGIWAASQMNRIRHLGLEYDTDFDGILQQMVFPLLYVNSSQWSVLFARPFLQLRQGRTRDIKIVIYRGINLGDTASLVGTYQLLRALRILRNWADVIFRGWWTDIVEALPRLDLIE
ncbi:hypothetical protein AK830_g2421 [Neonectria ditissima]|uniref:PD-(D/E)XK nuclease-like domain-containing protein n=1 Tax=Neonectria ditissima TaxID=78410 RepID=A0A0N8H8B1_9HYPO|nr:hypothetical protein AK830_g2421 [Neonectria ditissima]